MGFGATGSNKCRDAQGKVLRHRGYVRLVPTSRMCRHLWVYKEAHCPAVVLNRFPQSYINQAVIEQNLCQGPRVDSNVCDGKAFDLDQFDSRYGRCVSHHLETWARLERAEGSNSEFAHKHAQQCSHRERYSRVVSAAANIVTQVVKHWNNQSKVSARLWWGDSWTRRQVGLSLDGSANRSRLRCHGPHSTTEYSSDHDQVENLIADSH